MSEDLISNNFVDNINRTLIKKTFGLSKAVLSLTIIYAILELANWYIAISGSLNVSNLSNTEYYEFRILPVVAVTILIMSVINWFYCVKTNKLIRLSFENNDADLFNKAYQYFYRAVKLVFASFLLAIIAVGIRLLIK